MYSKQYAFYELRHALLSKVKAQEFHAEYLWFRNSQTLIFLEQQLLDNFPRRSDWFEPNAKKERVAAQESLRDLCYKLGSEVVETEFFKTLVSAIIRHAGLYARPALEELRILATSPGREPLALLQDTRSLRMLEILIMVFGKTSAEMLALALPLAKKQDSVWHFSGTAELWQRVFSAAPDKPFALERVLKILYATQEMLPPQKLEILGQEIVKTMEAIANVVPQDFSKVLYQALFVSKTEAKNWAKAKKEIRQFCLESELGHKVRFYELVRQGIYDYSADQEGDQDSRWDRLQVKLNTPWLAFRMHNSSASFSK